MMNNHAKIFSLGYCLIFFNPLNLTNEMWPFYAMAFILVNRFIMLHLVILAAYISICLVTSIVYEFLPLIEILQFSIVIMTCFYVSALKSAEIDIVCNIFKKFLKISLVMGLMQFLVPGVQDLTYDFFSGRMSFADALVNGRKVVTLFSPEPSYSSAHLMGIFTFLLVNRKASKFDIFSFFLLIMMTRALSSLLILPFLIILMIQLKILQVKYFTIGMGILVALLLSYYEAIGSIFYRLLDFIEALILMQSFVGAESQLGSIRILQIVNSVLVIIPESFQKPYSFLGYLNMTTMVPVSWLVIWTAVMLTFRPFLILNITILLALSGPILLAIMPAAMIIIFKKKRLRVDNGNNPTFKSRTPIAVRAGSI